jgi:hypothetical protein
MPGKLQENQMPVAKRAVEGTTTELEKNQLLANDSDVENWDYALEAVPPPRRSGTVQVTRNKVTLTPPVVGTDD